MAVGGEIDKLRDVGGPLRGREAVQDHRGRAVAIGVDVREEELRVGTIDLGGENQPLAVRRPRDR